MQGSLNVSGKMLSLFSTATNLCDTESIGVYVLSLDRISTGGIIVDTPHLLRRTSATEFAETTFTAS